MQELACQLTAYDRIKHYQATYDEIHSQFTALKFKIQDSQKCWEDIYNIDLENYFLRDLKSYIKQLNQVLELFKQSLIKKIEEFENKQFSYSTYTKYSCLQAHKYFVYSAAISQDSLFLLSGTMDGVIGLWDVQSRKLLQTIKDAKGAIFSIAYSCDEKYLAIGTSDNVILQWELNYINDKPLDLRHNGFVRCIKYTSEHIVSACDDGLVRVWSRERTKNSKEIRVYHGHQSHVYGVAVSSDEKYIASISNDCTIRIWDFHNVTELQKVKAHQNGGSSIDYSSDSTIIVSSGYDNLIKLWDSKLELIRILEGHTNVVQHVVFSADSFLIASAGRDREIKLWDVPKGKVVQQIKLPGEEIGFPFVGFSKDTKYIYGGGNDNKIHIWQS